MGVYIHKTGTRVLMYNIDGLDEVSGIVQIALMAWSGQAYSDAYETDKLTTTSNTGLTPPANHATRILPSCSNAASITCAVIPRLNEIAIDDLGESVATFAFVFLDVVVEPSPFVAVKIAMRPEAERASRLGRSGDLGKAMCLASESSGAVATSLPSLPETLGTSQI